MCYQLEESAGWQFNRFFFGPKSGPKKGPKVKFARTICINLFYWKAFQEAISKIGPKSGPKSGPKNGPKTGPSLLNCHPGLLKFGQLIAAYEKSQIVMFEDFQLSESVYKLKKRTSGTDVVTVSNLLGLG